jgi:hypothetical protein
MTAWESGEELHDLLAADPAIVLGDAELAACFSLERVHESARVVFDRLAGLRL